MRQSSRWTSTGAGLWSMIVGYKYRLTCRDRDAVAATISDHAVDSVFHLAAQTLVGPAVADPVDTFEHNVAGTWSVLDVCRHADGVQRVLVASSDKAYGDAAGVAYDESMALRAGAPYDTSKADAG